MDRKATLSEYRRSGIPEELYQAIRDTVKKGAKITVDGNNINSSFADLTHSYSYKVIDSSGNCYSLEYEPAPLPGAETGEVCFQDSKLYVSTPVNGVRDIYIRQ